MRAGLFVALWLVTSAVFGQYIPNNAQAFQLATVYNPAFSGVENYTDLKLGYRNQWSGFGSNAPKFINLSFNTRLRQPLNLEYNTMRISKPSVIQSVNLPRKKRILHGLSVNLFKSEFGVIKQTGGTVGYAINYPFIKNVRVAGGMSAVIDNKILRLDGLTFEQPDPFYQHLQNSPTSQLDVSLRAGLLLYSNRFYFGFSYLSLVNQSVESSAVTFEDKFYTASIHTGVSLDVSHSVSLKPSLLVYLQVDNKTLVDYNLKTYFAEKGWIGMTYRNSGNGIGMLGFNATSFLSAAYSYEVAFGGLQQFTNSTHEIMLILKLNNFRNLQSVVW